MSVIHVSYCEIGSSVKNVGICVRGGVESAVTAGPDPGSLVSRECQPVCSLSNTHMYTLKWTCIGVFPQTQLAQSLWSSIRDFSVCGDMALPLFMKYFVGI